MQKISSRKTYFYKKIFPFLWFGITGSILLMMIALSARATPPPLPAFLAPLFMMALGYFIMKKLVFDLVDEVYDAGDRLIVKKDAFEDTLLLTNIINVSHSIAVNPPRLTLTLRTASRFGKKISFCPKRNWADIKSFGFQCALADDLITRIDAARQSK
jgi:hypothetical protein